MASSSSSTLAASMGSTVQYTLRFNQYLSREETLPNSFFWTQHIGWWGSSLIKLVDPNLD